MYNIIQLNDKELPELQSIASELGIKKPESYKKDDLVYKILDEQAIAGATKAVSEKKEGQKRQRSRIAVKKSGDKVYTATNDKAVRIEERTPEKTTTETSEAGNASNAENEKKPKKRPGRPKSANKTASNAPVEGNAQGQERKEEAKPEETEKAIPENNISSMPAVVEKQTTAIQKKEETEDFFPKLEKSLPEESANDFIPIEDLPSEKEDLPSELIGKFEATKVEAPAQPAATPKKPQLYNKNNKAIHNGNGKNNNRNTPNNPRPGNERATANTQNAEQQERHQA